MDVGFKILGPFPLPLVPSSVIHPSAVAPCSPKIVHPPSRPDPKFLRVNVRADDGVPRRRAYHRLCSEPTWFSLALLAVNHVLSIARRVTVLCDRLWKDDTRFATNGHTHIELFPLPYCTSVSLVDRGRWSGSCTVRSNRGPHAHCLPGSWVSHPMRDLGRSSWVGCKHLPPHHPWVVACETWSPHVRPEPAASH